MWPHRERAAYWVVQHVAVEHNEQNPQVESPSARPLPREIAVRYVPIMRRVALRLARRLPSHVCVDDLVGAGFVGLVEAYRRYDPGRCDCFDAYAEFRIRGAMLDELRSADPLSRDLRALATEANVATRRLQARLGHTPRDTELAAELGLPLDTFRNRAAKIAVGRAVGMDAAEGEDGRSEPADTSLTAADEQVAKAQSRRALKLAIEALPPRLRQVVTLYYGDELTLRDIGSVLGVTESRVCQLHSEALRRLRLAAKEEEHEAGFGDPPRGGRRKAPAHPNPELSGATLLDCYRRDAERRATR